MVNKEKSDGALQRGFQLGKMGFGLTGSYLGYQFQNLFLGDGQKEANGKKFRKQSSQKLRVALQSMKGPIMKLGQSLSMLEHLMPSELIDELSKLQMKAPAMHPTLARAQFKASFGKHPEEVFKSFSPQPFAAASLGQVHQAVNQKGETVAVKIQYPAMKTAIANDFKLMRSGLFAGGKSSQIPKNVIEELEVEILKEVDYLNEARNIEFFKDRLSSLEYVKVPTVDRELSTDRVLTMSYIKGITLNDFLERKPAQKIRDQLGSRLLEMFLYQISQLGAFHADPHPGNYLFTEDGYIGLVDFGCVKKCSPRFSELIHCFLEKAWLKGGEEIVRMMQLMFGKEVSPDDIRARRIINSEIQLLNLAFPSPSRPRSKVTFNRDLFDIGARMRENVLASHLVQPEFPLYSRAELGLYNFLHRLGARINTHELRIACCAGFPEKGGESRN